MTPFDPIIAKACIGPGDVSFERPHIIDHPEVIELKAPALAGPGGFGGAGIAHEQELRIQLQVPQRRREIPALLPPCLHPKLRAS